MLAWTYPAEGSRVRAGAGMLAAAIVLRELSPFAFTGAGARHVVDSLLRHA